MIYPIGPGGYRIKYEFGGELPAFLSGVYTNPRIAQRDIDIYLSRRRG